MTWKPYLLRWKLRLCSLRLLQTFGLFFEERVRVAVLTGCLVESFAEPVAQVSLMQLQVVMIARGPLFENADELLVQVSSMLPQSLMEKCFNHDRSGVAPEPPGIVPGSGIAPALGEGQANQRGDAQVSGGLAALASAPGSPSKPT